MQPHFYSGLIQFELYTLVKVWIHFVWLKKQTKKQTMHNPSDKTRSDPKATASEISESMEIVCEMKHMATEFLPPAKI